jgi:2-dehydropantoate 2-reductase
MPMKILVMGAGAVGGYFGGVLSRSGADVTFVARGSQLEAMNSRGLRIESDVVGTFTVRPPAVERLDGSWMADLVIYCVKSYQNEEAMEAMRPAVGESTSILTLQNGIGCGEQLAEAFGSDKALLGATYIDAARTSPGVVVQEGSDCRIVLGEEDGRETARAVRVRDALRQEGIDAILSDDVLKALWTKLVYICALSGMRCITRASFAEVMDTPETLELSLQVMREAVEVGRANGVELDDGLVDATLAEFRASRDNLTSSMYLDLLAGNPLEVQVLNGAVSRIGRETGIATPANDFITTCLSVADRRARSRSGAETSS